MIDNLSDEKEYFKEKIASALSLPKSFVFGATQDRSTLDFKKIVRFSEFIEDTQRLLTGQVPLDVFIKHFLEGEMNFHRGRRRLRKKKAKRVLIEKWKFLQLIYSTGLTKRIDYLDIGKKMFHVEPIPKEIGVPYYNLEIKREI